MLAFLGFRQIYELTELASHERKPAIVYADHPHI